MEYTLGIVFNPDLTHVLLMRRAWDPYAGKINGIGGKLDPTDNSPLQGILRELREEIPSLEGVLKAAHLMTINHGGGDSSRVFALIIDTNDYESYTNEEGEYVWFPLDMPELFDVSNGAYANDGIVAYLIYSAWVKLKGDRI